MNGVLVELWDCAVDQYDVACVVVCVTLCPFGTLVSHAKRLNQSRCCLCGGTCGHQEQCIRWGAHWHHLANKNELLCVSAMQHTHTHPFYGPFSGTTRMSRYQKGKTNLDFTEARDSGISWAICKSAPCSRQTTTPAANHSVFYRSDAPPVAQPTASKHWRQIDTIWRIRMYYRGCRWCSLMSDFLDQLLS